MDNWRGSFSGTFFSGDQICLHRFLRIKSGPSAAGESEVRAFEYVHLGLPFAHLKLIIPTFLSYCENERCCEFALGKESMFRHALRSKAFSSFRRISTVNGLKVRSTSWSTAATQHGLRRTALWVKPVIPQARRSISGLSFDNDTIYALSSAQGRAGIAVIRISGPACADVSLILLPFA